MAAEGADHEKTGGADGTRAAATDRKSEERRVHEADRRGSSSGAEGRGSDAHGPDLHGPDLQGPDVQGPDVQGSAVQGSAEPKGADAKTAAAVAAAEAAGPSNGESVRIDSWIWSVRLVKTRSMGAAACRGGHVRVNGERVKPAYAVRVGDEVCLRHEGRERIVVVKRLIRKRVGAPVAVQCYIDNSPPPPPREAVAPAGIRDRGTGRPTKRDRRDMERLRGLGAAPSGGFGDGRGAQGRSGSQGRPGGRSRPDGRGGSGGF